MNANQLPISVLYLITELDAGGAQTALYRLLKHADQTRIKPVAACFYNGDKLMANKIRQLGAPVVDLQMTTFWRIDALWRLYKLLRRERPSILHSCLFHANFLGRIVGQLARVPVIITSRRNVEIGGPWRERLKRWTVSLDDKIVAVCAAARQAEIERAGAPPEKVVTIYNGIEPNDYTVNARQTIRREFDVPPSAKLLGTVGRMHPQKGHVYLLTALRRVRERFPDARLLVVGDGRLRAQLQSQVHEQQLEDGVTFTGVRSDIPEILSALDLFVLPSLWEGLPNVILEAMAAGLPVVATAVGGAPELVADGQTGLLVPPAQAEALEQAIMQMLENPAQAKNMGQAGHERVLTHFSLAQTVAATTALYDELLTAAGVG